MSVLTQLQLNPAEGDLSPERVGHALGCASAVWSRMQSEPDKANIENCERSLKNAASILIELWQSVQHEKNARREMIPG